MCLNPYPVLVDHYTTVCDYIEGTKKTITVNADERDPEARRACIRHYGFVCQCCGFDFEKTYGELGMNFIHVHHIRPLRTLGEGYCINPVTDLVPLCPNCHAMIHRGNEARPLPVADLEGLLNRCGWQAETVCDISLPHQYVLMVRQGV